MDTLTGSVERITYYNPENGYSVVRLKPDRRRASFPAHGVDRDGLITIVGNLPELTPGEYLKLQGHYTNHPKHGYQFQVEICEQTLPATTDAIRRYLGSGLIKGIGPKFADRIVAAFGAQTLDIIEHEPEKLRTVPDIGPKRTAQIKAAWQTQKQIKDIMLFLHGHGISTNLAIKIYKTYGAEALHIVRTDPYRLARDIFGVGFKTADKIAQSLGLAPDHPSRLEAGVIYTLNEMTNDGHTYTPRPDLIQKTAELLAVDPALIPPSLDRLAQNDRIHADILPPSRGVAETQVPYLTESSNQQNTRLPITNLQSPISASPIAQSPTPAIYLTPLYYGELGVARRLAALARAFPSRLSDLPPAFVQLPPELSEEQGIAIKTALTHPLSVLTGGPGTGKTTALKSLISILQSQRKRFALAAPTGRAAKRLSEATGHPAATIHRLLDYSPTRGFTQNEENPLPVDILVVDEASMLDLILANSLLKALEPGTHLLLVGDVDQLPSVGAGDVLRDVIASGVAPVTRLTTIFRQAAESYIISNAHRINQGQFPEFPPSVEKEQGREGDFFLFPAEDAESAAQWTLNVVAERIPARFGFDPVREVQVLAPIYRGPAGVRALNDRLQTALNPPSPRKPEKSLFGQIFRLGDKVMQTQNDYDKEVFNGDIGQVTAIDALNHTLTINFEGRNVLFDWMECDQLVLAYAVSVHKSQGAEFPCVVLPLIPAHYMMLQRNLLYTAITRAKKLCVLVGSKKAISMAVRNNAVAERNTALDARLVREIS